MSLRKPGVVDIILKTPEPEARTVLVIVDDGDIVDADERIAALQRKLAFYAFLAKDGGFEAHRRPNGAPVSFIDVICQTPPTDDMRRIERIVQAGSPPTNIPVRVWELREYLAANTTPDL